MVTPDYASAAPGGFVLSAADFGQAYLSDGWATAFMRGLIDRYKVVFVGYSADDPPIQYLLEALNRTVPPDRLYAFHLGQAEQAAAIWRHKGVTAIPFAGYDQLWRSIELWAARARNPAEWRASVASSSLRGPRGLERHERGQVAHLVSTDIGARAFAEGGVIPPAEWLCVFDPAVRRAKDRANGPWASPAVEHPDNFYDLDDDWTSGSPGDEQTRGAQPWSALEVQPSEAAFALQSWSSSLRGPAGTRPAGLPPRLRRLSGWVSRVAGDPIALWWGAGQDGLHPELRDMLRHALDGDMQGSIRTLWRLVLSSRPRVDRDDLEIYRLQAVIGREGYSPWIMRELEEVERPRLRVSRLTRTPPLEEQHLRFGIVRAEVAFVTLHPELEVPLEQLPAYVRAHRRRLEAAAALETEISWRPYPHLRAITPYDDPHSDSMQAADDLPAQVIRMARLMQRLVAHDAAAARRKLGAWPDAEDPVFRLLRVWAAGRPELTSAEEVGATLGGLSAEVFWQRDVQRDLLIAIARRWPDLAARARRTIEAKILEGPEAPEDVDQGLFARWRAHRILNRLFWIEREKLEVAFDLRTERAGHLEADPKWNERVAVEELDRSTTRGGYVATDTRHDALLAVPIPELLDACEAAARRDEDFLVDKRPFRGVSETRPARALAALARAAAAGERREALWNDFLGASARERDRLPLRLLIAARLAAIPSEALEANLRPARAWLFRCALGMHERHRGAYIRLWNALAAAAIRTGEVFVSSRHAGGGDLTMAINAPAGHLASSLMQESAGVDMGEQASRREWERRAEGLLNAGGEVAVHSAAVFASKLPALYQIDRHWTEENVVRLLEHSGSPTYRAALSSFLHYGSGAMSPDLFVRLRTALLMVMASPRSADRGDDQAAAGLVTRGWITRGADGERLISDVDFREALVQAGEDVRIAVLNDFRRLQRQGDASGHLIAFLRQVWPRQLVAKTARIAAALADLALSAGDDTPAVVEAVLPLLTRVGPHWYGPLHLGGEVMVGTHAKAQIAILHAVLPEDAKNWAPGTEKIVDTLAVNGSSQVDTRIVDLRQRSMAR